MFDGFLMSITNKLKKISASLDLYEGKFNEISTDVGTVNTAVSDIETKVDTVQTTSDEIKALIGTEVATQLSTLESNILAAMPSSSSSVVTPYNKKLTPTWYTTKYDGSVTSVSGVGLATFFYNGSNDCKLTINVDGKSKTHSMPTDRSFYLQIPFYSSIKFNTDDYSSFVEVLIQK